MTVTICSWILDTGDFGMLYKMGGIVRLWVASLGTVGRQEGTQYPRAIRFSIGFAEDRMGWI
jgi:hypothetical protein